jgi:thiol:disulfide interchange protein DsbD
VAVKLGYKNVYRYPDGLQAWQQQGLPVESSPAGLSQTELPKTPGSLYGWTMIWTLLGIFVGGMALNLTPCVYPMIPITVSYFGGQAIKGRNRGKLLINGLCYLLGLAITYSILGVVAALTGGLMGAMLQNPVVIVAVAIILVLFATSLFGLWEIRLPGGLTQAASKSYAGYFGSLFMGLTLGVVAAPCLGPFVLGILTWVASMGSPWVGFLVFFTLSLGLGLPLFVLAIFSGQLEKLPRSGEWMIWVKYVMGWVLVGMAAYFIRLVLPGHWGTVVMAAVVFAAGLHLGWIDKSRVDFRAFPWLKSIVGAGCMVLAAYLVTSYAVLGSSVTWKTYSEDILKAAKDQKKPVVIDFYATWCTPCRKLDEVTFRDRGIARMAENDFVLVRVDVTKSGNPVNEQLLQRYAIKGVPTILFIDAEGKERQELRLVDYLPPDKFMVRMAEVKRVDK